MLKQRLQQPELVYSAFVLVLFAKLLLADATLGSDIGQVGPFAFLKGAALGLLRGDLVPLLRPIYVVTFGSVLLASAWTLLLPRRGWLVALWCLDAFLSVLALADVLHFRYFQDFFSFTQLRQIGLVGALGGSIFELLRATDVFFFADFFLGGALWSFLRVAPRFAGSLPSLDHVPRRRARIACACALLVGASLTAPLIIRRAVSTGYQFSNPWSQIALYNMVGLSGLHAVNAGNYVAHRLGSREATPHERARVRAWFEARPRSSPAASPLWAKAAGRNVIVVQLEAFQSVVLGVRVGGVEVTPNLNALAARSLYFPNFFHQTGQGRTSDAEFAANCSLHRLSSGSVFVSYADNTFDCLPGRLKDAGFSTAVFHGNEPAIYNRSLVYPRMGFDEFHGLPRFELDERVGWALGDRSFFRQSVSALASMKRPFYANLITLTSHHPFALPPELKQLPSDALEPGLLADYFQSLHYLDRAVGELVAGLQREGLWDESVVVFFGDHDAAVELSSLASAGERRPSELERALLPYQVGLLVHLPGDALAGRYDQPVGQIDLAPSVMSLLGLENRGPHWMGEDLLSPHHAPVALAHGSFVGATHVLRSSGAAQTSTCFARATGSPVAIEVCAPGREQVLRALEVSETIVRRDLLTEQVGGALAELQ